MSIDKFFKSKYEKDRILKSSIKLWNDFTKNSIKN